MPSVLCSRRRQRGVVPYNISYLLIHAGLMVPVKGLNVLHLAECGLFDRLTLMQLRGVLTNKQAETESRMPDALCLEEPLCAVDEDSESIRVMRACVDKFSGE